MDEDALKKKLALDQFDIFELMGLTTLGEEQKKRFLIDMNDLIWKEFLLTRLDKLMTEQDLQIAGEIAKKDESGKKVLDFIQSSIPSFYYLALDFTRQAKIYFIRQQFEEQIKNLTRALKTATEEETKNSLRKKLGLYAQAKEYLQQCDWVKLKDLMSDCNL